MRAAPKRRCLRRRGGLPELDRHRPRAQARLRRGRVLDLGPLVAKERQVPRRHARRRSGRPSTPTAASSSARCSSSPSARATATPRPNRARALTRSALPPSGAAGSGGAGEPGDGRPVIRWVAGSCLRSSTRPRTRCSRTARSFGAAVSRARDQARRAERSQLQAPIGGARLVTVDQPFLTRPSRAPRAGSSTTPRKTTGWTATPPSRSPSPTSRRSALEPAEALVRDQHANPATRWDRAQTPGYDADTQSWYDPGGVEFPKIPNAPDIEAARDALALFAEAFSTFPFESETDRAVALALALTALVRRSSAIVTGRDHRAWQAARRCSPTRSRSSPPAPRRRR